MTHQHQNKPPREIELKLAVPVKSFDAVSHYLARMAPNAAQAHRRHEITTYFDTQDRILSRCGMSLRVRRTDGRRVQTLKANRQAGVAADRAEWKWPIDHDQPDTALLAHTLAAETLPHGMDLEPVFATDIKRTIHILELDTDTSIEAALDQGVIVAGETRQPVCELELELQKGESAALFRLALKLHAVTPLMIESDSKAARGYRLRSGAHPAAHKTEEITIEPDTSVAQAFRKILGAELGHLLVNQSPALAGDAEGIHQMRIAIRRLRAALTLFRPHLDPHASSLFQDRLQRVGRVFGEARDWDVFCLQIVPDALKAEGAAGWRTLLRQPAMAKRETAHQQFAREIRAPSFTALVLDLAAWVEQKDLFGQDALDQPIKMLCPDLLDRLARKVERRGRHIGHCSETERHALRKSLKKLRYGIDFLQAVLPQDSVKSYLRNCKKLQKNLGDCNDSVTAMALSGHLGGGTRSDLKPAVGALAKQLERRRDDGLHGLVEDWKAFQAKPRCWA